MKYEVKVGTEFDAVEVNVEAAQSIQNITVRIVNESKRSSTWSLDKLKHIVVMAIGITSASLVMAAGAYGATTGDYSVLKEVLTTVKAVFASEKEATEMKNEHPDR